jgi:hypothetical protein
LSARASSVKTPTNSGLVVDSSGVALGATGHAIGNVYNVADRLTQSHAVTATDNAKTTPGQLLKATAAGDLTFAMALPIR